jgi:transcriptional regulator with PAS, ATPase and Fis domain
VLHQIRGAAPTPRKEATAARITEISIVGDSRHIRELRDYVHHVSASDSSVLITGETGVGKDLVAELIHSMSPRRDRPCVAVNCAAIPDTLLESELFGYERGAFTGADGRREGALKSADGGTILLDEVGDMGLNGQAKILRAIEARQVCRLGGRVQVPIDVRVIAATNQDLERLVAEGRFRKDLYYRLNVVRVHLPPLRERKEDLDLLLEHYIRHFNKRFSRDVEGFTADALAHLHRYNWPGNVREVRNLVEAIFVNLNGRRIAYVDLPEAFRSTLNNSRSLPPDERERVLSTLFATSWNMSRAAQELNWSRMTLYRKLAKYQITRSDKCS